ncbi:MULTISPECIES: restriction endonuclease subunit S [Sphingobacterium]|uniref:restriction endonuclease subunit S n=1 Tax=Sphingobacterium TaxID=28453 RepID=UPI0028AD7AAB|nr:restriction endonuclease subunit S [Sphingobacterium multivorum]
MEIVKKKIGEITSLIKTGKTPPSKEERYYNGNINWYTPGDLDKGKFLGKSNRTITEEAVAENKATLLPKNTVVIGAIGDIGKLGITSIEACTNQQITGIRTNEEVYFEYFYYWLKANKQLLKSNAKNAILPILNNESIKAIKIQFPKDIDDQKRIAKILSHCEVLIQKRKESIDLLDELLRSTFREMFGDEFKKATEWKTKLVDVAPSIDSGWSPVCESFPRNSDDQWAVLKLSCVTGKNFDPTKNKACLPNTFIKKALIPQKGDLLFSRKNTFELVGATAYVFDNYQNLILPDTIFKINYNSQKVNGIFLWYLLNDEGFSKKVRDLANGAAGSMPNISKAKLLNLNIPSPSMSLQNRFSELVHKVSNLKTQFIDSLKQLENLYGSISQIAFHGKLDLSKINISDMEDYSKKEAETMDEGTSEENIESLNQKRELLGIVDEKKVDKTYLSENSQLYIDKSKELRRSVYLLSKTGEINIAEFREELMALNNIGKELIPEVGEYTAWQIDQHKSIERYISLFPQNILVDYPNINIFSRNQFDYSSMTLDDYYGIPDDVIEQYGSIEDKIVDIEFFFKKYFSNQSFTLQDVELLYNKIVYERGDWFKYEEMKEFVFKSMEGEDAFLTQTFEEMEISDNESEIPKTIKRVMLKIIS